MSNEGERAGYIAYSGAYLTSEVLVRKVTVQSWVRQPEVLWGAIAYYKFWQSRPSIDIWPRDAAINVGQRFKYGDHKRWRPGATVVGTIVEDSYMSTVPRAVLSDQRTQGLSIVNNRFSVMAVERARQVVALTVTLDGLVRGITLICPRLTWPDSEKGGVQQRGRNE